jgi:hypothetical protein
MTKVVMEMPYNTYKSLEIVAQCSNQLMREQEYHLEVEVESQIGLLVVLLNFE